MSECVEHFLPLRAPIAVRRSGTPMLKPVPNASRSVDSPSVSATRDRTEEHDGAHRNLLRRASEGDPHAVGELYDAHHRAVRALAMRLIGEEASAEDIVHDVFVALPRALSRFEGRSALRTFILSVAIFPSSARSVTKPAWLSNSIATC